MEIKLYHKDIKNIAENKRQGGGSHTALEVALARKVLNLQKTVREINDRYNGYFDTIYKISAIINRKYGKKIVEKAMTDNNAANKIFIQPPFLTQTKEDTTCTNT